MTDSFACTADRIFDGQRTLEGQAVLVEGGVISGVVPAQSLDPSIPLFPHPGCTIIPGLIDMHVHFMRWEGPLYIANGVTTVRDTGNGLPWILDRRAEWKDEAWPRILCAGPLLDGPAPVHPFVSRSCSSQAGAAEAVRELAGLGVDNIKLYVGLRPEWIPLMAEIGHAAGLKVSMHVQGAGLKAVAMAGVDEFFHLDGILPDIWPDRPGGWLNLWGHPGFAGVKDGLKGTADLIERSGLTVTPTLVYWESQRKAYAQDAVLSTKRTGIPEEIIRWQLPESTDPGLSGQWERALGEALEFTAILLERNVRVLPGSDTPCGPLEPGLSLWRELALLAEAGMTPVQALTAATSGAAAFLGRPELGRIGTGAAADMAVVRGNPLERIPDSPDIPLVLRQGTVFRPEDLQAAAGKWTAIREEPWGQQFEAHGLKQAVPETGRASR